MALTAHQNIPEKPEVKDSWTVRRLFSFGAVTTLAKVFINPFDVLLGYLVFILGVAELLGRRVSWFLWVFTVLILLSDILERRTGLISNTKLEEKKK